jgi:hypothetical protein
MTRRRIALVCALTGLTLVGANVLIDAVATGFYNCYPDPYFPEPCMVQKIAPMSILVACWLVATYLLARREAIGIFACAFMGLMLWFGILAAFILSTLVIESQRDGYYVSFEGIWEAALIGVPAAMAVVGLLTAGVGHGMQVSIQARRQRRLPRGEEGHRADADER